MAWPMMEYVLDTRYAALHHKQQYGENSVVVFGLGESTVSPVLNTIEARWPDVLTFSLPSVGSGGRPHIELVVKGRPDDAAKAFAYLRDQIHSLGGQFAV